MNIIVRKGEKKDIEKVYNLVKELAIFEKAEHELINTPERLYKDCFENEYYDFFVATANDEIVGICIYYTRYSTWKGPVIYVEDIVVNEKYRSLGVGKKLFECAITLAKEKKYNSIQWQVLNWNSRAIDFYRKFNATFDDEWLNGKITIEK